MVEFEAHDICMLKDPKELSENKKLVSPEDFVSIAILAGGLSRRFGRDKSKLRIGPETLLRFIKRRAVRTGHPVRVVRKDKVPRCGPLGGIITAFARTRATLIVFLACDMPAVSESWIVKVLSTAQQKGRPVFSSMNDQLGFPFALFRRDLEIVERQRESGRYSLKELARSTGAVCLSISRRRQQELRNINTPEDWAEYCRRMEK